MDTELNYTPQELDALRKEHAPAATDEQFTLWLADCRNRGLEPVRDVLLQIRPRKEYDAETNSYIFVKRSIYITTIAAFRKIAERSGKYAGQGETEWIYLDAENKPSIISTVPLAKPEDPRKPLEPWAVRVPVLRKGFDAPMKAVARFDAYAQRMKSGDLTEMWQRRGPEQLEKCGEALGLRKAFPDLLSKLYIAEELERQDESAPSPESGRPTDAAVGQNATGANPLVASAPVVPEVNHEPATPVEEPKAKKTKKKETHEPEAMPPESSASHPAPVPEPEKSTAQPAATPEERRKYITKAKELIADMVKGGLKDASPFTRAYILKHAGVKDEKNLTVAQWEAAMAQLIAAQIKGTEELIALVKGDTA